MSRRTSVRIRGIYATALTVLLLEQGFTIVDASPVIQTRCGITCREEPEEVSIFDRRSRQGVVVEGMQGSAMTVIQALRHALPHALFYPDREGIWTSEGDNVSELDRPRLRWVRYLTEFPATVKGQLDRLRSLKAPTIAGHHALKIINATAVEEAESRLAVAPEQREALSQRLREHLLYTHFQPGDDVLVRHLKAGEAGVELRGHIESFKSGSLLLVRRFKGGGIYDGLRLPIETGDWGTIRLQEGEWVTARRYLRRDGTLVGEFYNIGTPVEFYLDHLRYVDLELDVVRLPDGTCRLEDEDVLTHKLATGLLPPALGQKAIRVAVALLHKLAAEPTAENADHVRINREQRQRRDRRGES